MQDLNDKVTGSTLTAAEWNEVPSELQNPIVQTGQSLTSADLNQLGKAIAAYAGAGDFYTDNGSAGVITLLAVGTIQTPPAYRDGLSIRFIAGASNVGAVTIQLPGLGVIPLRDQNNVALVGGDIVAGVYYEVRYSALFTAAVLQKASAIANVLPRGYISGLTMANNTLDAVKDLDILPGVCKAATNDADFSLGSAIGKRIDAVWTEGGTPGATVGGFPSGLSAGSPVAGTWYRVFAIWKPTGQIDAGFDTATNAAALLADATADGYTKYRQIGWIFYNGSSVIQAFTQSQGNPNLVEWNSIINDLDVNPAVTTQVDFPVTAPPGAYVVASLAAEDNGAGSQKYVTITSVDKAPATPSAADCTFWTETAGEVAFSRLTVRTDASSQICYRCQSTGTDRLLCNTVGFEYYREAE